MPDPNDVAALRSALEFYANPASWQSPGNAANADAGKTARAALGIIAESDAVPLFVKAYAPSEVSWRGSPVEIAEDGSCMITPEALEELRPHGVRPWAPEDEIARDKGDVTDPANMSRKDLLGLLKGRGAGNITLMDTDELRELAVKYLAGESIVKKDEPDTADGTGDEPAEGEAGEPHEPDPADGGE